jgi:uncharacterized lipoprotein YajG
MNLISSTERFQKNKDMKAILIILAILLTTACKTYNITFQEMQEKPKTDTVYTIDTVYIVGNRFTKQFIDADRAFQKASNEAAKSALESTKHLLP